MNILIVDDDKLVRNWLSILLKQIPDFDISLCEASDAAEALRIVGQNKIDLVFTDIRMPGISGIELIDSLTKSHPRVKTAVLSAYDDFEYVRIALKNGALDYLLKPEMTVDDICSILQKTQVMLSSVQNISTKEIDSHVRNNERFQRFIHKQDATDIFLSSLYGEGPFSELTAVCMCINPSINSEALRYQIMSDIESVLSSDEMEPKCFIPADDLLVTLLKTGAIPPENKKNTLDRLCLTVSNLVNIKLNRKVVYTVVNTARDARFTFETMSECLDLTDRFRYYGRQGNTSIVHATDDAEAARQIEMIRKKIEACCLGDAYGSYEKLLDMLHNEYTAPHKIKSIATNIITMFFSHQSISRNCDISLLHKYILDINTVKTKAEFLRIMDTFSDFLESFMDSGKTSVSGQILDAIHYINDNYMNKLYRDEVAAHVFLNSAYFSQMFKKQLGVSFSDYLENIRISKAKELLRDSSSSITTIADKVGFSSQNYFTTVFTSKVGISPFRFRQLYRSSVPCANSDGVPDDD